MDGASRDPFWRNEAKLGRDSYWQNEAKLIGEQNHDSIAANSSVTYADPMQILVRNRIYSRLIRHR